MNFTNSPFERMMKEIPRPGRGGSDPCAGCRHLKECRGQNGRCQKKFRTLIVEPRTSGQVGPRTGKEETHIETIQGYEILKTMTFDNGRGFALGHNEAAPNPFVTWQFTETENGQRDYYWGHYHNEMKWAEKDFLKRIDDYKYLFHVQERPEGQQEKPDYYRYYSTQRPVDLGTFPKPPGNAPVEIINFDERRMVEGGTIRAWGELAYLEPLTEKQVDDYELHPAPGNPDRDKAHPSITAKLQAARRQEPPKEPGKAKHHKSHEDR